MLVISNGALEEAIFLVSISTLLLAIQLTFAPNFSKIVQDNFTSLILGIFSIIEIPLTSNAAGSMATAAFFAPLIVTSPLVLLVRLLLIYPIVLPPKIL